MAARRFTRPSTGVPSWRALRHTPRVLLLLIPAWITVLTIDEPAAADAGPVFFRPSDIMGEPLSIIPALVIGPLVHLKLDQTLLVTGQLILFGIAVERRLTAFTAFAVFWATTAAGALAAGLLLHVLHAGFPDADSVTAAWERIYSGGSVGGFGLMGALAALSRRPWVLVAIYAAWELVAWYFVLRNFTPAFHGIGFVTGYAMVWYVTRRAGVAAAYS